MWWMTALGRLSHALERWRSKLADAATERQRIEAEAKIKQIEARMEAQTRGDATWAAKLVRAILIAPYAVFTYKIIMFDKVVASLLSDTPFVTEDLTDRDWELFFLMVSYYFLLNATDKVLDLFRR